MSDKKVGSMPKGMAFVVAAAAVVAVALCWSIRIAKRPDATNVASLEPSQPASASRPRPNPLILVEQSPLGPPSAVASAPEHSDDLSETTSEEEKGDEDGYNDEPTPETEEIPVLRDDDPALIALNPEVSFVHSVWDALSELDGNDDVLGKSARLLDSNRPEDRALGGILLFFAKELSGDVLDDILDDEDILVPLVVCDWIRDHGLEAEAEDFKASFTARGVTAEELLDFVLNSAGLPGGGRSALDVFLSLRGEEGVPVEDLADIVASDNASYDVREQAFFKLLEPETREKGEEALAAFAAGLTSGSGDLNPFVAAKMADLAEISNADGDEEKIWDAESAVVFFLAQTEGGLQARDLANYLEYALRRDDPEFPPVIEEGTWEFANEFLLAAQERINDLPQADADALDRIAICLDRLVEYDPAFNPFETLEDGEDSADGSFDSEEDDVDEWEEDFPDEDDGGEYDSGENEEEEDSGEDGDDVED